MEVCLPTNLHARGGRLVYPSYNDRGDRIPDFSHGGGRGGGVALPHVAVVLTRDPRNRQAPAPFVARFAICNGDTLRI